MTTSPFAAWSANRRPRGHEEPWPLSQSWTVVAPQPSKYWENVQIKLADKLSSLSLVEPDCRYQTLAPYGLLLLSLHSRRSLDAADSRSDFTRAHLSDRC